MGKLIVGIAAAYFVAGMFTIGFVAPDLARDGYKPSEKLGITVVFWPIWAGFIARTFVEAHHG